MTERDFSTPVGNRNGWIKSSYSNSGASCVEVKMDRGTVLVRDSKDRRAGRPVLRLGTREWALFLTALRERTSSVGQA